MTAYRTHPTLPPSWASAVCSLKSRGSPAVRPALSNSVGASAEPSAAGAMTTLGSSPPAMTHEMPSHRNALCAFGALSGSTSSTWARVV
jgi:hypothetical protein